MMKKLLTVLFSVFSFFYSSVPVLAAGDMYLYVDKRPGDTSNQATSADALIGLLKKYLVNYGASNLTTMDAIPVNAHHLSTGVYILQTLLDDGTQEDLIFRSCLAAENFEKALKAAAKADTFYAQPYAESGTNEKIAVGYTVIYPGSQSYKGVPFATPNPSRVVIRYYYLNNRWGDKGETQTIDCDNERKKSSAK